MLIALGHAMCSNRATCSKLVTPPTAVKSLLADNSVLVATSPIKIQLKDYKYNEDTQDYEQTMSVQYNQPVPGSE